MRLTGKRTIVVSTGDDEISSGIVARFQREGAKIFAVVGSGATARQAVSWGGAAHTSNKLSSKREVDQAIRDATAELGGVDVLVNNAIPASDMGPLEDKSEAAIQGALMGVSVSFWAMQAVFPALKAQRWGRIINVGSRYGQNMNVYNAEYNAATSALYGLTRAAAAEWARWNIKANMLETAGHDAEFEAYKSVNPVAVEGLVSQTALGRRGDPENDIGAAAAMLACDEGDWISGILLFADGGQHLAAPAFVPAIHMGFGS